MVMTVRYYNHSSNLWKVRLLCQATIIDLHASIILGMVQAGFEPVCKFDSIMAIQLFLPVGGANASSHPRGNNLNKINTVVMAKILDLRNHSACPCCIAYKNYGLNCSQ